MLPFSGAQQTLQIKDIRLDWYSICIYCRLYICTYLFPVLDPALGRLVRVPALRHPPVVLRQLGLEVVVEAEGGGIVLLLVRLVRGLSGARPSGKRKQKETEKQLGRKQNQNSSWQHGRGMCRENACCKPTHARDCCSSIGR